MAKKKTAKRRAKTTSTKKTPKPGGTPAPLDPVAAALARRRAAMIRR